MLLLFCFFKSACLNVLKHQRRRNVGFIPGYSRSISLQSGDLSLFAFFSRRFTSEASPQVVAYFAVAMATAHGKPRVLGRKEKEKKKRKTFRLPLEGQLLGCAWVVLRVI